MKHLIENIEIDKLIPYARNSRTHSDKQISQIESSIKEFGFTNPVLIDKTGMILAGHGRVIAAKNLKLKFAPCIRLSHLTESQKKAYVIADNKIALNAGWDDEKLREELDDLVSMDFNIELLGFDDVELSKIFDETKHVEIESEKQEEFKSMKLMIEFRPDDSVDMINRLSSLIEDFVDAKMTVINE